MRSTVVRVILIMGALSSAEFTLAAKTSTFDLRTGDVVVFAGGTNMVRLQQAGYLETFLTHAFRKQKPKFRDWSWEADTVFRQGSVIERWRSDGFGNRQDQLKNLGATIVISQFGKLESMAGPSNLGQFKQAYSGLVEDLKKQARLVVLISPTRFEKPTNTNIPDISQHNESLALYVDATKQIAAKHELPFIDLFNGANDRLTTNGMHTARDKQRFFASIVARKLGITAPPKEEIERLRLAVIDKHRLWIDYWRPANWKLLYGDDSRRQFTKPSAGSVPFREEWKRLVPLIEQAEQRVWRIANGVDDPVAIRPKPEILYGDPNADIENELKSFTVADGLKVNLFASEKQGLTSPLAIRWDPSGRAYVTVTTTYPHVRPGDVPNDKIIVLEDSDGDGTADKSTVFAEGLNIPTGLELGDGGVYVGQSTEILFLKDTDGDGKADVRRTILSGFGNGDSHQTINSFVWSPGGELYMGQGDGIESRVETPWGSADLFQAGFYRLRPRRLQLDPLLDDFMGPGNPWGVAFDKWGQIFSVDGAGGVTHLSLGQIPTTHRLRLGRIGNPGGYCGIARLDGRHLPKSLRGQFAVGDFKSNRVKCFSVTPDGAGFKLRWEPNLLRSSHRNFRPVDVRMGPDGAVYVVDWYNPITCHQDDKYRDPRRDKAHGRIWRIASSSPLIPKQDLAKLTIEEVLNSLKAPEGWTRFQAKRELTRRDSDAVAEALKHWVQNLKSNDEFYEHHLFEALGTYATLEIVEPSILRRLLEAKDSRARAFASRIAGRWHDRMEGTLDHLARRAQDENAQVRMEAIAAVAHIRSPRSIAIIARAVDLPIDASLNYVLTQAIHHLKPVWEPALKRGDVKFDRPAHLSAVLSRAGSKSLIADLRKIADATDSNPTERAAAIRTLISIGGPDEITNYGLNTKLFKSKGVYDADLHAGVLEQLQKVVQSRGLKSKVDPSGTLKYLLGHEHSKLRVHTLYLCGKWKVKEAATIVESLAVNADLDLEVRRAAFVALARINPASATDLLVKASGSSNAPGVRMAAIEAMCLIDLKNAANLAGKLFSEMRDARMASGSLLTAFVVREGGGPSLASALESVKLEPAVARHMLQAFYNTGYTSDKLLAALQNAAHASIESQPYNPELIREMVSNAKRIGRAERGKALVKTCVACHKIGETGGVIGPDLTSIGTTLEPDRIIEELLWPNRQVKEGYSLLLVTTKDGDHIQGYERRSRQSNASGQIVLRKLTSDTLITLGREKIESIRKLNSGMPTGLTAGMSGQQQLDLIRYLMSLGKVEND